jgi:hypothetical protein
MRLGIFVASYLIIMRFDGKLAGSYRLKRVLVRSHAFIHAGDQRAFTQTSRERQTLTPTV